MPAEAARPFNSRDITFESDVDARIAVRPSAVAVSSLAVIRPPLRSASAWAFLLVPLVVGLAADLWTKHLAFMTADHGGLVTGWAQDALGHDQVMSRVAQAIPRYLHFQAHLNYGAVFGIAQNQRLVFVVVSIGAIVLLGCLFARSHGQKLYQILLGILFAGVLGNLYDRVVFGYVRDMIYALPGWDVFPWIFNIADSLLCTGVGGMILYTFWHGEQQPVPQTPEPTPNEA